MVVLRGWVQENDLFNAVSNPRGSKLRRIQDKMQKALGIGLPLLWGRGVFNYSIGALPHRRCCSSCWSVLCVSDFVLQANRGAGGIADTGAGSGHCPCSGEGV